MAFTIDKDGNITLIQGDSGELVINGLPTDKNYSVYFAIQDENRNPIGSEIELDTNNSSSVIFTITGSLTNLLTVKRMMKQRHIIMVSNCAIRMILWRIHY